MTSKEIRKLLDSRICLSCKKPIDGISLDGFCSDTCVANWDYDEREPRHVREDLEGEMTTTAWLARAIAKAKKGFRYYNWSKVVSIMVDGEPTDVMFYCLGCKASHWFYVGILSDGRLVERWVGESCKPMGLGLDHCDEYNIEEGHRILAIGEYPSYLGHW